MPLDNLSLSQSKVSGEIWANYKSGLLPQSLLFYGPSGSSRLTGAMDLAFSLTGEENNRDILRSRWIIYLPHREMAPRLKCAKEMFQRDRTSSSRIFLLETMRLILMQYHEALSSAATSTATPYFSQAGDVSALLMEYEDQREYTEKEVGELVKCAERCLDPKFLYGGKRNPSPLSIDQVRAVQEYFSMTGEEKVVVMENIEEATEGARNSLLKMLEEPEEHSHVILLSSNPQKILETILSRVRKFQFPPLGEKGTRNVLSKRFGVWESFPSFDAFYFQKGSGQEARAELERVLGLTLGAILSSKRPGTEEEESILASLDKLSAWPYFLERLTSSVNELWRKGKISPRYLRRLLTALDQMKENTDTYNMNSRLAFDLFMREAENVQ